MVMKALMYLVPIFLTATLAQTVQFEVRSVSLPLVTVGSEDAWGFADDYVVRVTERAANPVVVEVFSPDINRSDSALNRQLETYYGDEVPTGKDFLTTFSLGDPAKPIAKRSFTSNATHRLERIFEGTLAPGVYPFKVAALGSGKNSFAVRASGGVQFEASQFNVNLRSAPDQDQLVAFINIPTAALGQVAKISNYDGDGATEMRLTLILPDGSQRPLTVSGDKVITSDIIPVTTALVGRWQIVASTLMSSKQFSNSFGLQLKIEDRNLYASIPAFDAPAPKTFGVSVVDSNGNPVPDITYGIDEQRNIRLNLPPCYQIASATILEGQGTVLDGVARMTSEDGKLRFVVTCPGVYGVTITDLAGKPVPAVTAFQGGFEQRNIRLDLPPCYSIVNATILEGQGEIIDGVAVMTTPIGKVNYTVACTGVRVRVEAQICGVTVPLPNASVDIRGQLVQSGQLAPVNPGTVEINPLALPDAYSSLQTVKVALGQQPELLVTYTVRPRLSITPQSALLEVGAFERFTVSVSSDFPYALPAALKLRLPSLLTSADPLELTGTVGAGNSLTLPLTVQNAALGNVAALRATLNSTCQAHGIVTAK